MNRRGFLKGILAAGVAPAVVGSGILMPVRKIWAPYELDWMPYEIDWSGAVARTTYAAILRQVENDFQRMILEGAFKIDQRLARFYEQ